MAAAPTIHDLADLGYTVGIAHGHVEVEQEALQAAIDAAAPQQVATEVQTVLADTLQALHHRGRLPRTPTERHQLAEQIANAALEELTDRHDQKIVFHRRALEIAKTLPDVWHVAQHTEHGTVLATYVATGPDGHGIDEDQQQLLESLANREAFAEREQQAADAADATD